jgi:hypothetical protein
MERGICVYTNVIERERVTECDAKCECVQIENVRVRVCVCVYVRMTVHD